MAGTHEMPDWVIIPEPPTSLKTYAGKLTENDIAKIISKGNVVKVTSGSTWALVVEKGKLEVVVSGDVKES